MQALRAQFSGLDLDVLNWIIDDMRQARARWPAMCTWTA
jgi:hypothetical protein